MAKVTKKKSVANKETSQTSEKIQRTDTLGKVIEENPEIAPLLMQAGLHCIGCHVSAYESIQDGCASHGMNDKQITELVKAANALVAQFDKLPAVKFSDSAIEELIKRAKKAKNKYVRIVPAFGEYDFEATDEKRADDLIVSAALEKKTVSVLIDSRTERILKGILISYDKKQKDFVAKSERELKL